MSLDVTPFSDAELARIDAFLADYPFRPLGWIADHREYAWPIEEYLARTRHGRHVRERIAALNQNGKPEGSWPRGWHPHPRSGRRLDVDAMPVREFVRRFGHAAYRAVPKRALLRHGHRKGIATMYVLEANFGPR